MTPINKKPSGMRTFSVVSLLIFLGCISGSAIAKKQVYQASIAADCPINPTWISAPSLPSKVKTSAADGSSNFCDFYQFSTQAYLYLMSPSASDSALRNFQDAGQYHVLEYNGDNSPGNSCDAEVTGNTLQTSLDQSLTPHQAGSGSMIYAQDGSLIHYDVRFNKEMCDLSASATDMTIFNFPDGTTELKFAWKKLTTAEISSKQFVTQQQTISGESATLGLVGMHIAIATTAHPEFVWATFEHITNAPNCDAQGTQTSTDWLFANKACTESLPSSFSGTNCTNFNKPDTKPSDPIILTNICRQHPYGTASGDRDAAENLADIMSQNTHLTTELNSTTAPMMKVLTNYFNVGDIWVSDIKQSSGGIGVPNERGSLRLANSVAETDFQDVNLNSSFSSNCFGCHNYKGTDELVNNNITSQKLSHTFKDIVIGQGKNLDVTSGQVITSTAAAPAICGGDNGVCKSTADFLQWNGNWTNTNTGAGSVCGCEPAN